jgi:hypothetical protein
VKQPTKIQVVRFLIGGSRLRDLPLLSGLQGDLQRLRDMLRDVALDGEDVGQVPIIIL